MTDKIIKSALTKLKTLEDREENSGDFDEHYFVDENILGGFQTKDWQVIFGRRGSGKTTLLKALHNQINSSDSNDLALTIDMRSVTPSDYGSSANADSIRYTTGAYFRDFIQTICLQLSDNYLSQDTGVFKKFFDKHKKKRIYVDSLMVQIVEIAEYGLYIPVKKELENHGEVSNSQSFSLSGKSKLSPSKLLEASGEANIHGSGKNIIGNRERFVYKEASRYRKLKRLLEELLKALQVEVVYILIDEWTYLDKTGNSDIQPLFAEFLNRTFNGLGTRVSLKISAIRGSTRLYKADTASAIGLELNADIFEALDLDTFHANNNPKNSFFESLIFKKMIEAEPLMEKYSAIDERGLPTYEPLPNFVRSIFKESSLFDEVVEGSGKIPRDFNMLFKSLAR